MTSVKRVALHLCPCDTRDPNVTLDPVMLLLFLMVAGLSQGLGSGLSPFYVPMTYSISSITHTRIHIHIHLSVAEDRTEAEEKILRDKEAALKEKAARDQRTDLKSRYSISSHLTVSHRIIC